MHIPTLLTTIFIISHFQISGYYVPANGDDWTKLKPNCEPLEGSFDTIPFVFGIVVNPYFINEEGELEEPPVSSIERSLTTSFVTSIVTAAPKPTKTKDIIHQIQDGQVQKVKTTEECNEEEEEQVVDENGDVIPKLLKRGRHDSNDIVVGEDPSYDDTFDSIDEIYEDIGGEHKHEGKHKKKHSRKGKHYDKPYEEDHKTKNGNYGEIEEQQPQLPDDEFVSPVYAVACYGNSTLRMTLNEGILRDSDNRIGSIVSGHQFQFDGPTPQHGAIYASGWSITKDGQLALGDSTKFFQCASGDFYNLYDEPIAYQCHPVTLDVVELIEC